MELERKCSGECKETKKLNTDNFYKSGNGIFWKVCKVCARAKRVKRYCKERKSLKRGAGICSICGGAMDMPYRSKYVCAEHNFAQRCCYCDYEDECRQRVRAAKNVVCELQSEEDIVRAELRMQGVL